MNKEEMVKAVDAFLDMMKNDEGTLDLDDEPDENGTLNNSVLIDCDISDVATGWLLASGLTTAEMDNEYFWCIASAMACEDRAEAMSFVDDFFNGGGN